jgi:hypothetical protein
MVMAMASQLVAGFGVEDAAAQEGGADQQVDDIKHEEIPKGGSVPPRAAGMLRCARVGQESV